MNTPSPTEMTLQEWAALSEDEEGELVDGHLVEEEVPDSSRAPGRSSR